MVKFTLFKAKIYNRSGIILMVALWVMVILSLLAVGLGRRTGIDLTLAKYAIGKMKADALAWAGVLYAIDQIKKDGEDKTTNAFDVLYQCGIALEEGKAPEDILRKVTMGDGYFDVGYKRPDLEGNAKEFYYGLENEESKINLNAVTQQNYKVLSSLIVLLGFDEETAATIASAVVDWKDADAIVTNTPFGAEDNDYMSLPRPYHCKNFPFESPEELLLVKGVTPEIFSQIKKYLTVFPAQAPTLLINPHTASDMALRALARSVTGPLTNTDLSDADSLTDKIIRYRRGDDDKNFTADDRLVDGNEMGLNPKEMVIYFAIKDRLTDVSNFLRVKVRGVDAATDIRSNIEAVIERENLSVIYWHKN